MPVTIQAGVTEIISVCCVYEKGKWKHHFFSMFVSVLRPMSWNQTILLRFDIPNLLPV